MLASWIALRRRARTPNYIVLACTADTLEVFHAGVRADEVGRHRATYEIAAVTVNSGADVWDLQLALPDRRLHITRLSCDESAVHLFEVLTARPFTPLPSPPNW